MNRLQTHGSAPSALLRLITTALLVVAFSSIAHAATVVQTVASDGASSAWNADLWGSPAASPSSGNTFRVGAGLITASATKLLSGQSVTGRVRAYSDNATFAGGSLEVPAQTELLLKDSLPATFDANVVLTGGIIRLSPNAAGIATLTGTLDVAADSHVGVVHTHPSELILNSTLTGGGTLRISAGDSDANTVGFGGALSAFTGTLDIGGGPRTVTVGFNQNYDLPDVHVLFGTRGTADRFKLDHNLKFATFTLGATALESGTVYTAADLNALAGGALFTGGGTLSVYQSPPSSPPPPLRVLLVGDSTVATWAATNPEKGWGQAIPGFFDDRLLIDNRAKPGASSKTFITQGLWTTAKSALRPGDYVLIQFGHNDAHGAGQPESTDASTDYKTYLQQYIDETKAKGATPVLVTPMYRRSFDANGNPLPYLVDSSGNPYYNLLPYAVAMREVAEANQVTCIDLFAMSGDLLREIGNTATIALLAPNDVTHWNQTGAMAMAALVARGLAASTEPLKSHLLPYAVPGQFAPGSSQGTYCPPVSESPLGAADFALLQGGSAATVVYSTEDAKVVEIAAALFADDIERVGGVRPAVTHSSSGLAGPVVLVGTIGQNPAIDALIAEGRLDVSAIAGTWERYRIEVVDTPMPGVSRALVIVGSDRRGTAYGVFSLSEAMGVSPWYWWADVPARARSAIHISATPYASTGPSVQFRGIFINDEDWGLQEWSEKNFESGPDEVKDIGPKTYAKVFELLLRLRANYLWPAMHPSTRAFNAYADSKVVADDYAIVMGSSHAEPMLRNNVDEWSRFVDPANGQSYSSSQFHYGTNQGGVYRYWEQRVIANGAYENVYTLGKRGIHDSGMVEGSGTAEKSAWLNTIFADQRRILARHVNPDPARVPQIFVPYKEVLDLYDSGLVKVPDDVALVWPDDNHGYIRRVSGPVERLRPGGGGVYYHLSYWGAPADYLWLNSIPPALVWSEMTKAYQYNCNRLWVFNVGDIKPAENGMEFALRLAWDVNRYDEDAQQQWFTEWAAREFGAAHAADIASVLDDYHRLAHARKPEHMKWADNDPLAAPGPYPLFSYVHHADEAAARLADYADLVRRADAIHAALPAAKRGAFYQTVLYPVCGADGMNRKFLNAGRAHVASIQERNTVAAHNAASRQGYDDIQTETAAYNALEGGKWREMMDSKPRSLAVFNQPSLPTAPTLTTGTLGIAVEGRIEPAYLSSAGVTHKSLPGYVVLDAVNDAVITAPMQATMIAGKPALHTPNGAGTFTTTGAAGAGRAVYAFNVATAGTYTLSCEIHCPTADDDSWFIQFDNATAATWNNLSNNGAWTWTTFGTVALSAGQHTLTVHQREDGPSMARLKLASTGTVLVEDRAQTAFQFPEFNAFTQRACFLDLFNTGTGSVAWQITTADPWVVVSKYSGSTASEERLRVWIDWANAPRTGSLTSGLTVTSAGRSFAIPVKAWSPTDALPADVDRVEDNHAVAIEAEHYSAKTSGADAAVWSPLPGLGAGTGAMFVSPPTASSRATVNEIVGTSPCLEYRVYLRQSGPVTVTTVAIPTLPITPAQGLRYAVSFDDQAPQIVDMSRASGSGNLWSRSVLRGAIEFSTSHALGTAGAHTLKVWMVTPGVVLDRLVISTDSLPHSYGGPPETVALSHGRLTVSAGRSHSTEPGRSTDYDALINEGVLNIWSDITVFGDMVNDGVLRLYHGARIDAGGQFVNNGVLDRMTWDGELPANFVNNGTVLDRSAVRITGMSVSARDFELTMQGHTGHNYQLQQAIDGDLQGGWADLGAPVAGSGAPITFLIEEAMSSPRQFFRVNVRP